MAVFDFLAGSIPAGEELAEFDTYDPALTAVTTNPNLGADGFSLGWWHRIGKRLVVGGVRILFSGTGVNAGSGTYEISLPLPADTTVMMASTIIGSATALGTGVVRDNSSLEANSRTVTAALRSATLVRLQVLDGVVTTVNNTQPFTWAASDRISFEFKYVIEPGT